MNERIDKWLWHVRIFKTRSKAADACRSKKITINTQQINKSSSQIKIGDVIQIKLKKFLKTVEVLNCPHRRIGPKLVSDQFLDKTPESEYLKKEQIELNSFAFRERGLGRPTKKERRDIEKTRDFKKT